MSGDGTSETRRYRRSLQEAGEPFAASRVQLQNIDRFCLKHPPEIEGIVTVFPSRNLNRAPERDHAPVADHRDHRS